MARPASHGDSRLWRGVGAVRERSARPRFSGRSLEAYGNISRRDMVTAVCTIDTEQNPAYRPTLIPFSSQPKRTMVHSV